MKRSLSENKSEHQVTEKYTDFQIIDILRIPIKEYMELDQRDRVALKYYLMRKSYIEKEEIKKMRDKQDTRRNLPKQLPGRIR